MNEQHGLIFDRLNEFFEELNQQDVAPNQEVIELYIKEIYAEVTSLNADNNPYLSRHSVLERLYNLADLTCDFAEIFEEKFFNHLNALNFRNIELKIAKQYKMNGGNDFWRNIWEIYADIALHYSALNIDSKALSNAKTALKLMIRTEAKPDPKWISFLNSRIAYAYQDIAPDKSINYFNKSSDALIEYNKVKDCYENNMGIILNDINIAIIMLEINQVDDAIKQCLKCLDTLNNLFEKYGENEELVNYISHTYSILSRAYFESKDYDNAEKAIEKGLSFCKRLQENKFNNYCEIIDILYSTKSLILCEKQRYMKAIELQYKLLDVWSDYKEGFKRSTKICDIYVEISMIFSKYLDEQGMSIESARLAFREIKQYTDNELFMSDKYALSVRRRCYINLADAYFRARMYQSAISSYTNALDIMKEEFDMESEKISLVYSYSYTLYQLAMLDFKYNRKAEGCKRLSYSYRSVCTLKKYGGVYEVLFNMVRNALSTYEKKFDGKIIELDTAQ